MAARDVLKNFNLFVDGRGYAGQVQDYTPPDLTAMTEDFRAGGMDGPIAIPLGIEALTASVKPVVHLMRGRITSLSRGTWTPGAIAPLTVTMRPDFYSETIDGVVISVIDLENMIRIIGGVDQLASQRAALGI
jgi:phage tail tube protein FII